ncbi:MAG: hypothetical protein MJ240_02900 [Kiritimatiellae bacterium]|nr:hypothetical protein [Kiritimatiellia bacterium]
MLRLLISLSSTFFGTPTPPRTDRPSTGFSAAMGISQDLPSVFAPGIRPEAQKSRTRRGVTPHPSAISATDLYPSALIDSGSIPFFRMNWKPQNEISYHFNLDEILRSKISSQALKRRESTKLKQNVTPQTTHLHQM